MLLLSFTLLAFAVLLGAALALLHLRPAAPPLWPAGALHGMIAVVGFLALLPALQGPPRGVRLGVGAFGNIAAVLLGSALVAGFVLLAVRLRRKRLPGGLIGVHATLAVSGFVILAAYTLIG